MKWLKGMLVAVMLGAGIGMAYAFTATGEGLAEGVIWCPPIC
jgi:hypothetical protein